MVRVDDPDGSEVEVVLGGNTDLLEQRFNLHALRMPVAGGTYGVTLLLVWDYTGVVHLDERVSGTRVDGVEAGPVGPAHVEDIAYGKRSRTPRIT